MKRRNKKEKDDNEDEEESPKMNRAVIFEIWNFSKSNKILCFLHRSCTSKTSRLV